jgi:hypothetical protein
VLLQIAEHKFVCQMYAEVNFISEWKWAVLPKIQGRNQLQSWRWRQQSLFSGGASAPKENVC